MILNIRIFLIEFYELKIVNIVDFKNINYGMEKNCMLVY